MQQDEFEELYEDFLGRLDQKEPADVLRLLRQFGVNEDLLTRIQERYDRDMQIVREQHVAREVVVAGRKTWYTGPRKGDKYWPTIKAQLEAKGWSTDSISSLDRASTQIVSHLDHPKTSTFASRGLVIGHVQSGKTTNFTAVMAKSADRNYKFFIVLAGIHNGLRRQTQLRLKHDLIDQHPDSWFELTTPDSDFRSPSPSANSYFAGPDSQKILCVVKKNGTVLRKLRDWLASASEHLQSCATLIIDDEADQASVATPTINPLILEIMAQLPRSVYLGYTATPFANLLINPASQADLYPRDFVINLPAPDLPYFGTEDLFGRESIDANEPNPDDDGYDMIRAIPDTEVDLVRPASKKETDAFIPNLEGELERAILYFWLGTAARRVRGVGNRHSTMLVHTSVRTDIHESFKRPLEVFRRETQSGLRDDPDLIAELRDIWSVETAAVPASDFGRTTIAFDDVLAQLPGVLADCQIILDNARSSDRLDYEQGPVVAIAVGGNTLSRGLTLEGLIVSYFVRAASAYDTLLQMGRWFGYREGYEDIPRVWLTNELRTWFRHLATVEAEVRRDAERYLAESVTPVNFAVRIRLHPAMRVTAAAKMTEAVRATTSFGGARIQTHYFDTDEEAVRANLSAATRLLEGVTLDGWPREKLQATGSTLWRDVSHRRVTDFLSEYRFHEAAYEANDDVLIGYIKKQVEKGRLETWNVVLMGNRRAQQAGRVYTFPGVDEVAVGLTTRTRLPDESIVDIKTLMSRQDAAADLDTTGRKSSDLTEEVIFDLRAEQQPTTGLLVLYVIDKDSKPKAQSATDAVTGAPRRWELGTTDHLIGVGVVFPREKGQISTVEYISADLSNVEVEDDDLTLLEMDES